MIELQAFGPLHLRDARGPLESVLAQPKRAALLVHLILARPRRPQPRDSLLSLFWPEADDARARSALSQSLSYLRRALPADVLMAHGGSVGLRPDSIRADVIQFEAAVAEARWAEALTLYRGELLAGLHVADAPGFERWASDERERLRTMAARSAWSRAGQMIHRGDLVAAERMAQRGLLLMPTEETTVREFIERLAEAGERAAALRLYERFRTLLDQELDVEPSPETAEAVAAVRSATSPGASKDGRSAPVGRSRRGGGAASPPWTLAVLPFRDLTPGSASAPLADGMTEDILARLAKVKRLQVTSGTSVLRYRETRKPVREIAAELGVTAVLEGSVRTAADRVRVVAQLIDARTDSHLWSETYDREMGEIFDLQSDVAESVARALEAELSGDELTEMRRPPTQDLVAYSLFREGMAAVQAQTPEEYNRALGLLEAAVRLDPEYAHAHAGLALTLTLYPWTAAHLPDRYHERLEGAVTRALELDPESGHAWLARSFYLSVVERDWLGAESALHRAGELEPDDLNVGWFHAFHALRLGRFQEASRHLDRIELRDQASVSTETLRAAIEMYLTGFGELDVEQPLSRLDALLTRAPDLGVAHVYRATALTWADRPDEALASIEDALRTIHDASVAHGVRGSILARLGRREEALAEDTWFSQARSPDPTTRAFIHFGLGDLDQGFAFLEVAADQGTSCMLPYVRVNPSLQPLWGHPRFQALMETVWPGAHKQVLGEYGWRPTDTPGGQHSPPLHTG